MRRLPERVDELFGQLLAGQLFASVSFLSDKRDSRLLTRLVDRVVLAIIAAPRASARPFCFVTGRLEPPFPQ